MTRNEYRAKFVAQRRLAAKYHDRPSREVANERREAQARAFGPAQPPYRGPGYVRLVEPPSELGLLLARQAERRLDRAYWRELQAREATQLAGAHALGAAFVRADGRDVPALTIASHIQQRAEWRGCSLDEAAASLGYVRRQAVAA